MTHLIAVDPSTNCTGLAYFDIGVLQATSAIKRTWATAAPHEHAAQMVNDSVSAIDMRCHSVQRVVIEWPQIYRASKSKGDPADLLALAGIGVGVGANYPAARFDAFTPRQWTAGIKKETNGKLLKGDLFSNPRAKKIATRLSAEERRVFDAITTYDELDAIGIGLHALGRGIAAKRRVLKGAT